ncbi:AAA family ATPase [Acidothermaceae bacterium B102]|nr:AAA family ATPase [Acidothermaceae bacterium B102]
MSDALFDQRPVRRVAARPGAGWDAAAWPYSLAPVAHLLRDGLDVAPGVTFLVGENGSGKSTLVEAIAAASGNNAEGGSRNATYSSRATESPLHEQLQVTRSVGAPTWSYFLRAETMHGHLSYLEDLDDLYDERPRGAPARNPLHRMSHGESFLEVFDQYFARPGFYLMDEPESALSFTSCLVLIGVLDELVRAGSQVVCATHSPILTALPGATILQVDDQGLTPVTWRDLDVVDHFTRYLANPTAYLRHLLE